jgi:DNA-binding transcriptional LysR family regulator
MEHKLVSMHIMRNKRFNNSAFGLAIGRTRLRKADEMHFDLIDLRLFAAVADEGSLTAGASRAGISLPSASARIKGMEQELGTALFERHRRGVKPTPAGYALIHHSQLVLAQMERLRGDLREHARGGMRAHIRLMANTTAQEEYLPDALAGWLAANPGVDIELKEGVSHEIAPAVAQAHTDIGILTDLAGTEGLETYPFRFDRLVLVVPRGHAQASTRHIAFVDVLDEEFVGLVEGSALTDHLAWQSARLGRSIKPRIRLRGLDAVCRMVDRSVGIAVVPETAARRYRRTMALSIVRLDDSWATRRLIVCVRSLETLPLPARRLVSHLTKFGSAANF